LRRAPPQFAPFQTALSAAHERHDDARVRGRIERPFFRREDQLTRVAEVSAAMPKGRCRLSAFGI
jgi:hypothetical protein